MTKSFFLMIALLAFFMSCATGVRGRLELSGEEFSKTKSLTKRKELVQNYLDNLKVGKTKSSEIEEQMGLPTKILNIQNREIWIYEVTSGSWFLIIGSAKQQQYVFEFKDQILVNYYVKNVGNKTGIFYPTIFAEPLL